MTDESYQAKFGQESLEITIFHTNDMHGHLEAMVRLSHFAHRLREDALANGRRVFFWDAGDAADRRIPICSLTKGAAFSTLLNAMGYDLQTMGNAIALPYGPQALKAIAQRVNFPILAANCRDGDGPLVDGLQESVIIPLSDHIQLGVFGLTAPWGNAYDVFGLHFPDFNQTALNLVKQLKEKGAQIIIVLSHLGLEDDRKLAYSVPGIHLIIGAHSHDRLPSGEECNGVLITQAGEYAQAIGRVDLTLDPIAGKILDRSAQVFDVPEDEPPDQALLNAIYTALEDVRILKAKTIGELKEDLDSNFFSECGIGNLAADALRERLSAEAAFISSGQLRQGLNKGKISIGQLDEACFSSANPCLTVVSGQQILDALERGLDPQITQNLHHSYRGTPIGIPQISGMQVRYDPQAEVGCRIKQVIIGDESLNPQRSYRFAHTDAETMTEVGYLKLEDGQKTEHEVPTIIREVLEDYLQNNSPVGLPKGGRWIPMV